MALSAVAFLALIVVVAASRFIELELSGGISARSWRTAPLAFTIRGLA